MTSLLKQIRQNAQRFSNFLSTHLQAFRQGVAKYKRRPRHLFVRVRPTHIAEQLISRDSVRDEHHARQCE